MLEKLIPLVRADVKNVRAYTDDQNDNTLKCCFVVSSLINWHVSIHVQQHTMVNLRKRARLKICTERGHLT